MKNEWYKNKWFWIFLIFGLFLFVGNIVLLVCLRDCQQEQSAWLTLFGGWLGFIATLIIGIIAYKQSKRYTVITQKQEYTNLIRSEFNQFLHEFLEISKTNQYVDNLISLIQYYKAGDVITQYVGYSLKNSEIRDNLINYCNILQSYLYISNSCKPLCDTIIRFLKFVMSNYNLKIRYYYINELNKDIESGVKKILNFIMDIHKIKNECAKEYNKNISEISTATNLIELQLKYDAIIASAFEIKSSLDWEAYNEQVATEE